MKTIKALLRIIAFLGFLASTLYMFGAGIYLYVMLTEPVREDPSTGVVRLTIAIVLCGFFWWLRRWASDVKLVKEGDTMHPVGNSHLIKKSGIDRSDLRQVRIVRATGAIFCFAAMGVLYVALRRGMLGSGGAEIFKMVMGFLFLGPMAVIFAIQAITGLSLRELSFWWNDMRWWQRGVIGTAVVFFAFYFFHVSLTRVFGIDMDAVP